MKDQRASLVAIVLGAPLGLFAYATLSTIAGPAAAPTTQPATQPSSDVNVRFMLPGSYFAGSNVKDDQAPGGFGTSDNLPKRLAGENLAPDGKITLVANTASDVAFADSRGFRLLLINGTNSRSAFRAGSCRRTWISSR